MANIAVLWAMQDVYPCCFYECARQDDEGAKIVFRSRNSEVRRPQRISNNEFRTKNAEVRRERKRVFRSQDFEVGCEAISDLRFKI